MIKLRKCWAVSSVKLFLDENLFSGTTIYVHESHLKVAKVKGNFQCIK